MHKTVTLSCIHKERLLYLCFDFEVTMRASWPRFVWHMFNTPFIHEIHVNEPNITDLSFLQFGDLQSA